MMSNMYEVDYNGDTIPLDDKHNAEPRYELSKIKVEVIFDGDVSKVFNSVVLSDETIANIYRDIDNHIIEGYDQ
jgi:hypothetical protein|tara:strand:+ start:2229 stop:2450 length:222 start_codon:yes stop_codon:yes gene_type:complete